MKGRVSVLAIASCAFLAGCGCCGDDDVVVARRYPLEEPFASTYFPPENGARSQANCSIACDILAGIVAADGGDAEPPDAGAPRPPTPAWGCIPADPGAPAQQVTCYFGHGCPR